MWTCVRDSFDRLDVHTLEKLHCSPCSRLQYSQWIWLNAVLYRYARTGVALRCSIRTFMYGTITWNLSLFQSIASKSRLDELSFVFSPFLCAMHRISLDVISFGGNFNCFRVQSTRMTPSLQPWPISHWIIHIESFSAHQRLWLKQMGHRATFNCYRLRTVCDRVLRYGIAHQRWPCTMWVRGCARERASARAHTKPLAYTTNSRITHLPFEHRVSQSHIPS